MSAYEINSRYQKLVSEHSQVMGSIQAGLFSPSEAAIAMADLRGRMNNLQRLSERTSHLRLPGDIYAKAG